MRVSRSHADDGIHPRLRAGYRALTGAAPRIAIVAGETSGDRLGAKLIHALRAECPDARFEGMAGPEMIAAGCRELAHIDELSVMGLVEVLAKYPALRRLRDRLARTFLDTRPDVFVGIDVPDFNLGLAGRLRRGGIATAHVVCPQVWAWRAGRARRIGRDVDRLLAVLPFEPAFFEPYGIPTIFVGHPLADELPLDPDPAPAREALGIAPRETFVAIMPGSRGQELARLLRPFLEGAALLRRERDAMKFAVCVAREAQRGAVEREIGRFGGGFPCEILSGRAAEVLTAADAAIVASGTVSLEALLCRTPMVVGYRLAPLSYHIIRRMISIPYIAMPNILAGEPVVPELIQGNLTPAAIRDGVQAWLTDGDRRARFADLGRRIHQDLRRGAARNAAQAVLQLARR